VLMQRNHLLRQVRDRRQPVALLEPWDTELVTSGAYLIAERERLLAALNARLPELYRSLSGGPGRLEVVYRSTLAATRPAAVPVPAGSYQPASSAPTPAVEERFQACLTAGRDRELAQGVSLFGPHRDDLDFLVDGVQQGVYGSRGQQRLSVLALKLAEVGFMRAETDEPPLLLLDDVLSELDPERRATLAGLLPAGGQTLITSTTASALPLVSDQLLEVSPGEVRAG
jgi:DNA replication and repair protein RecF